jgi:hypothetical protein
MKADAFLSRCEKVRATGNGTWIACCPSHEDKNPSMTVRELDDQRVLVHCFAGCSVEEILGAVGLEFDALFPDDQPKSDYTPAMRRPFPAADVLAALSNELGIIAIIAGDMESKREVSDADIARLRLSRTRIETGMQQALGLHLRAVKNVKRG